MVAALDVRHRVDQRVGQLAAGVVRGGEERRIFQEVVRTLRPARLGRL